MPHHDNQQFNPCHLSLQGDFYADSPTRSRAPLAGRRRVERLRRVFYHRAMVTSDDPWTVRRVVAWTRAEFERRGIGGARLDAEVLLAHALGTTRMQLYLELDKPLLPAELQAFRGLVKRRAAREPVSHVVGQREFWSRTFKVGAHTLAPRPETELIIEEVLAHRKVRGLAPVRILDVGTGTGCLAVTLALEWPEARVTAVEVSADALAIARENAAALAATVEFIESDVVAALAVDARFDVVVSNPPYLFETEWESADPEVRLHEPRLALVGGGVDGLDFHRRLAVEVLPRLAPGGVLWAEIGWQQGPGALDLWSKAAGEGACVDLRPDLERRDRVVRVSLRRGAA